MDQVTSALNEGEAATPEFEFHGTVGGLQEAR
jgi:hypothetical protein